MTPRFSALFLIFAVSHSYAGLSEGRAAYKAHHYAAAYRELLPVAESGNAEAQDKVGLLLHGRLRWSPQEAVAWWTKSAEGGNGHAQATLGFDFASAEDHQPYDMPKALYWLGKAAAQGDPGALTMLGGMYSKGDGVPTDAAQSVAWYRQAARQTISREYQQAVFRYRQIGKQAADDVGPDEPGYSVNQAREALGYAYLRGRGLPQNRTLAYFYIGLAARWETDDRDQEMMSQVLPSMLSPVELAAGRNLLQGWKEGDLLPE